MVHDIREERRRNLEEEFFARQNKELASKLRAQQSRENAVSDLSIVSGIKDVKILEKLYDAQVSPSALTALAMVPLVLVAWADNSLDQQEQEAILKAAKENGIDSQHPAYNLLLSWLRETPDERLFETWQLYIQGLRTALDQDSFRKLQAEIVGRTRAVAESAGGFLGLGSKVSSAEKAVLDRLDNAFQAS